MELETECNNPENSFDYYSGLDGIHSFSENYNQIMEVRNSDTNDLRPFQIFNNDFKSCKTTDTLDPEIETGYELPRIGICCEVLFYIAMKRKGVYIEPSSLRQDLQKHIDFFVLGFPVDITSIYPTKNYIDKFKYRDSRTLLVPFVKTKYSQSFKRYGFYLNKLTYAYDLIKNNSFDHEEFLNETVNINYQVLQLIEKNSNDHNNHDYGLKPWQFGNVPRRFVKEQTAFLQCLSDIL